MSEEMVAAVKARDNLVFAKWAQEGQHPVMFYRQKRHDLTAD